MSLIVEDGTVVTGAESYESVASFKTYCDNFGLTYAAYTDAQIEQSLRKATQYLTQMYRTCWKGWRTTSTQALDWPRYEVYTDDSGGGYRSYQYLVASDIVPTDVKNACVILAQKALTGIDLFADGTQKVSQKTVGPITFKYEQGSPQRKQFDSVEALLSVYLTSTKGVNVPLVRG